MSSASDIQAGDWIDRRMPAGLRPYLRLARLDRPIGTWLLLIPCWWSLILVALPGALPDLRLFLLFALGAILMRGAGCTINDIADRDLDSRVARTANRPLASGALTRAQAFLFLALQAGLGFLILLTLPPFAIGLGIFSLLLVALYPFMKRITWWPQLFLGFTFNWGALMGWAAVANDLAAAPLWLYAAGIFWTLFYDTIYAHQDKADDALIGVRSSALRLGAKTRPFLAICGAATIILMALALRAADMAWPAYLGLFAVSLHLLWQGRKVDLDDPASCLAIFRSNRDFGLVFLAGLILARLVG